MPVQYPLGVMKEHLACRASAGLFDVSHMGQVRVVPKSGELRDAALALETLIPVDVAGLGQNRQRYGFFTNETGGITDDLMLANRGDHIFLVVNAACKDADIAYLRKNLSDDCEIDVIEDRALIALQGPKAEEALSAMDPGASQMKFMDVCDLTLDGITCWVSRSGYTGEDGYEISVPSEHVEKIARSLLSNALVEPIGLGARDSLRMEGGLCLYGNDIDTGTSPIEAGLKWAIQKARRGGGDREGGFPGAKEIIDQIENGVSRHRVGLKPVGRAPMRAHTALFADEQGTSKVGEITSGGFGPSVEGPVAMGYVKHDHHQTGTQLFGDVRGKFLPVDVVQLPFVPANFKR